ncbi:uncharacterized protein [Typha angustifolia]|uniref:uncharacterized protein n=1 Tax=Typha angustifolia TaxID=59011 RepID=UPI003C2D1D07
MVKTVVGEETQLKPLEDRLFGSGIPPAEVGLIIGKLSPNSDRGLVYALIATPPTDGGGPACSLRSEGEKRKAGSKGGKSSMETAPTLVIDGDWVAEHARQVSRMLLGGMDVVGVYVWASEGSFKATPPAVLSQVVRGVAQASPWYDSGFDERLLIHISYSPRRWVCRICTLGSSSQRPCDFKMGKLLASVQAFRCMYNFEIRLPIFQVGPLNSNTFKNAIFKGINHLAKEVRSAKALVDGDLVLEDLCTKSEGLHEVELLSPFKEDVPAEACSSEEVAGLVVFNGSVCASAYLGPRESVSEAISNIKADIITSLRSRLDIIAEEVEGQEARASEECADASAEKSIHQLILHELRKPCSLSFPRRVLVPWSSGIYVCDYLQPSETLEDTKDRCKEMLSMEAPIETSAILELEAVMAPVTIQSFWDVVNGDSATIINYSEKGESSSEQKDIGKSKGRNLNFLGAIFFLLLALLVGFVITSH